MGSASLPSHNPAINSLAFLCLSSHEQQPPLPTTSLPLPSQRLIDLHIELPFPPFLKMAVDPFDSAL